MLLIRRTRSINLFKTLSIARNFCGKGPPESKHEFRKEITWNIPNTITMSRIASTPLIGLAIVYDYKMTALTGCLLAVFSDWLDGYIAKKYDQKTVFGSFLDPLADKIFMSNISIALAYQALIPLPLVGIIIGRDIILVAGSFIIRYMEKSNDSYFFDTTNSATFHISPSNFSKSNSALQFMVLSLSLSHFCFQIPSLELIEPLWWITSVTTIGSGLEYLTGSGITKIIHKSK